MRHRNVKDSLICKGKDCRGWSIMTQLYSHGARSCEDNDGSMKGVSHCCSMKSKHSTHIAL